MTFAIDSIGKWGPYREFYVARQHVQDYAEATNDECGVHRCGDVAPPVFAVIAAWSSLLEAVEQVVPDDENVRTKVLHGEQDISIKRPLIADEYVQCRGRAAGVIQKGSNTIVVVQTQTSDESGALVSDQWGSLFYRDVPTAESCGVPAPARPSTTRPQSPPLEVRQTIDPDQSIRYANASGDFMPIHLDTSAALAVGLPGIIVHGLCTMAFSGRAVVAALCDGDPFRLRRLAVRFSNVVEPGQELRTELWPTGSENFGFQTFDAQSRPVLTDGFAEVRAEAS